MTNQTAAPKSALEEKSKEFASEANKFVRDNPWIAVAAAMAIGFAIATLMTKAAISRKKDPAL